MVCISKDFLLGSILGGDERHHAAVVDCRKLRKFGKPLITVGYIDKFEVKGLPVLGEDLANK